MTDTDNRAQITLAVLRRDIHSIQQGIANVRRDIADLRTASLALHQQQEDRLRQIEIAQAARQQAIHTLEDDVQTIESDLRSIQSSARLWDAANSLGALVATLLGLSN